jgi:hypothetical protein
MVSKIRVEQLKLVGSTNFLHGRVSRHGSGWHQAIRQSSYGSLRGVERSSRLIERV